MREPGLIDLINFIEDEMVLVNDPLFSGEAVGQYEDKSLKQQSRSTKHKFQTHVIKEIGDSAKRDKAKCPVCDDHHNIEECQVFLSQTTENRSKTLIRRSYAMDALAISPKNTMQKVVPIEGCAKFAVEDTPLFCMV